MKFCLDTSCDTSRIKNDLSLNLNMVFYDVEKGLILNQTLLGFKVFLHLTIELTISPRPESWSIPAKKHFLFLIKYWDLHILQHWSPKSSHVLKVTAFLMSKWPHRFLTFHSKYKGKKCSIGSKPLKCFLYKGQVVRSMIWEILGKKWMKSIRDQDNFSIARSLLLLLPDNHCEKWNAWPIHKVPVAQKKT